MNETVAAYRGPFYTDDGETVASIKVVEIDTGLYDLFDESGECWNLGCWFPFIPTEEEVTEFILTGKIKGKIE
jgi:hypothetical protein